MTLCRIFAVVALLSLSLPASAAPCDDNPRLHPDMKVALSQLKPRWASVIESADAKWALVQPVLAANCVGCHEVNGGSAPDIDWTNQTVATSKCASLQDRVVSQGSMPPGGAGLSAADRALVASFCAGSKTELGISELFSSNPSGVCFRCHQRTTPQQEGYMRYEACGNCHTNVVDAQGNPAPYWLLSDGAARHPEWLNFKERSGHLLKSYYLPGRLKAEAMSARATDGTMPPGANATKTVASPAGQKVGWCDEITAVYNAWVKAGFPQ